MRADDRCLRVLVVEDEAILVMAMEAALAEAGHAMAAQAGRLDHAMKAVSEEAFDVAILDVNLDGLRVFPAADALARRGKPFVFLSACGPDIVPERFWDRPFIRKPYSMPRLVAVLSKVAKEPSGDPVEPPVAVSNRSPAGARSVPPRRRRNTEVRPREHLTPEEVERLVEAAQTRTGRHGLRDAAMILLAVRHGLSVGEVVEIRRGQVDLDRRLLHIDRLRGGEPGVHHLSDQEVHLLEFLMRNPPHGAGSSSHLFVTERRGPITTSAFRKQLAAAAQAAGIPFAVHPHMLRHACGFGLALEGHDPKSIGAWMGHKDARHAIRYAAVLNKRR